MSLVKALILTGDGINCEVEMADAFRQVGFTADIRHINDLVHEAMTLDELSAQYQVLALPGGFSFGDDISSGKILALKILFSLNWDLHKFAERGGLVLGVCNGFQTLIRLAIFGKDVSITHNVDGKFINTWVRVNPSSQKNVWLKGVGAMDLPIRHGEGRIIFSNSTRREYLEKFERQGMVALRYQGDPNGSEERIAGLGDSTGRILGLMPHPEAFLRWTAHPEWTASPSRAGAPGQGLALFENAFREVKGAL